MQTTFVVTSAVAQRARLIQAARHAFVLWGEACDQHISRETAIHPSAACIAESAARVNHRYARYQRLEAALAEVTGLNVFSVYNDLSVAWPLVPRLMTSNL